MERARRHDRADDRTRSRGAGRAPGKRTRTGRRGGALGRAARAVRDADGEGGEPLPDDVRLPIELLAGADLTGVRVHTGPASAAAASTLRAEAYTSGQDIHFAAGRYQPDEPAGKELLTHEIGHALQQRGGGGDRGGGLAVSQPGDPGEREADSFAAAIAVGSPTATPGVSGGGGARPIARWGEWCEDLFGGDDDASDKQAAGEADRCDDDGGLWDLMTGGGAAAVDGAAAAAFTPRFAAAAKLTADYNERLEIPVEITNVDELAADDWFDVAYARTDSRTGALLYQGVSQDPFGGFLEVIGSGVETGMRVHAKVTIHRAGGAVTTHTVRVADVGVRRPAMALVPGDDTALDNLVPGDSFTVEASFANVADPAESPLSVWPQLQSLSEGDPLRLTSAAWQDDRMVLGFMAVEPGAATLRVSASAPGYSESDTWHLEVREHATGGEHCTSFSPRFAPPRSLAVGFNERIHLPVALENQEEFAASGVKAHIEPEDALPPLTYEGKGAPSAAPCADLGTLSFTADQEGSWDLGAAVTFTDPADGSKATYTPQLATVDVGTMADRAAENEGFEKQLKLADNSLGKHQAQQLIGLDLLRDQLGGDTEGTLSEKAVKEGASELASLVFDALLEALGPEAAVVAKLVKAAAEVARTLAQDAAAKDLRKALSGGEKLTVAHLRASWAASVVESYATARRKLVEEEDGFRYSPTGLADATALAAGLHAVASDGLQQDCYLAALATWTDNLAASDAPWEDEGELRIRVRMGGVDDDVTIVSGTIDGLPDEVREELKGHGHTIKTLVDRGVHVEIYQTGDNHFEMSSDDTLLATQYRTGSAAYYLVDRANARHGTSIQIENPGAAVAAAWHVWTHEILPLSLSDVITD